MEREDGHAPAETILDGLDRALDLVGAGHEDKRVAGSGRKCGGDGLGGAFPNGLVARLAGEEFNFHRERAAFAFQGFARRQVFAQSAARQRGGHDDELEIGPLRFLEIERAGEREIAEQVPLVKFVEEDRGDAAQCRIGQHAAEEDALGDVEDARGGAGDVIEADLVTDFLAQMRAALVGDAAGEHACSEASRLENDHEAITRETGVEEHLRNLRRFARAGGRAQDEAVRAGEAGDQIVADRVNGQRRVGHEIFDSRMSIFE